MFRLDLARVSIAADCAGCRGTGAIASRRSGDGSLGGSMEYVGSVGARGLRRYEDSNVEDPTVSSQMLESNGSGEGALGGGGESNDGRDSLDT